MWNTLAFLLSIALVSLVTNLSHNAFSLTSNSTGGAVVSRTPTQPSPKLTFPTEANLASYYAKAGNLKYNIDNTFTYLSQRVPAIPNNVQVASTANLTSIASQSLNNGTNQILLTITTDEGGNWS